MNTHPKEFVRAFTGLSKNDAHLAGGKGASLGEMSQAGIPVPPGFVVLSESFEHFIHETDLVQEIDAILDKVNHKEIHTVEAASEKIKYLILSRKMPEDIATAISAEFTKLGAEYVAVRSSATAEDGKDHAWAGQLESYLNVKEEGVLEKVQHCWASLFTPRAIFYRFEKGLHSTKISVAVVVQKMVNSERSGIAFSVHPVTEDYNQLIIEAGFGLGEAIVSGSVTPDSYVVEKEPRNILDINVSTQDRALYRVATGGNEWRDIPEPQASSQVLTSPEILSLSEIILRIENHYGFPCDIEWAYEAGKFYIVQSRPITTLAPKVENKKIFESPELQGFDYQGYDFDGLWKNDLFATCFWQDCWVPDVVAKMGLDMESVGVMNLKGGHYLVEKSVRARVSEQVKKKIDERSSDFFKNLVTVANEIFSWGEKQAEVIRLLDATPENFEQFVTVAKKLNFLWLVGATYTNWPVEEKLQDVVIRDHFPAEHALDIIPKIVTPLADYQHGLKEIKKVIDTKTLEEVKGDKSLYELLEKHAEKYPWVQIFNFIGESLTPETLYEQITHLKEGDEKSDYKHNTPLSEELVFVASCMSDVGFVKQAGAEYFSIFSERVLPFLRKVAGKLGVSYREFMCLSVGEIKLALEGKMSQSALKEKAENRMDVNDWALIGGENGRLIFIEKKNDVNTLLEKMIPKASVETGELRGQIGNRGKYTGHAKIVMNTYDFDKIQPGDVLISTMTTPDFIVLMQKSGAIVTDIGGLLCHAAIVSRELNKPCVIGTKFSTRFFKDGDMVEVDAEKGIVRKIS
jgi:phosphoenolpyruvate synthase/pyruvate phosphate dikinase